MYRIEGGTCISTSEPWSLAATESPSARSARSMCAHLALLVSTSSSSNDERTPRHLPHASV